MYAIIIFCTFISIFRIIDICVKRHSYYVNEYEHTVNRTFKGLSAPRGRILDVNGKVLVDNIGVNTLIYNRVNGITQEEEVEIALKLGEIIDIAESKITDSKLKKFYLLLNDDGKNLISDEEYRLFRERKLSSKEITALKYERITEEMLSSMSPEERKASHIYYALSNGYAYQNKIVKKGLSDEEVARVGSLELKGIDVTLVWERVYPYGSLLRSVFGSVSDNSVPKELKDYYLGKGLSLDSSVGVSFLEYQYDDYLRGEEALFQVDQLGHVEKIKDEKTGNDLYLSLNIDIQLELDNILKNEMLQAKRAKNTEFYNHSYVIIGHPQTGEIVAFSGLLLNGDHFIDITSNVINSSYTVGSIVKGASMSVGYDNNLIEKGKFVTDSCVKVYGVQQKCSWTSLGAIDDIRAMAQSSNYYQFLIAIRLANPDYSWNSKLNVRQEHFDIYRKMFASYGLGTLTGIDLPGERTGIIGKTISDDLLLNLAIGQYDTYTPIEVFQYINSIANGGKRIAPSLMSKIENKEDLILKNEPKVLNEALLTPENLKRVQTGLREVMISGTGRNYGIDAVQGAGKTGTSETFVDSDADGKMDTKTISNAFINYAPYDNPEYSIVIISPNISVSNGESSYKYALNLRVNRQILGVLFEKEQH